MSSRHLKILAVSTDYPPLIGGIATLSSQVVRELVDMGHEVRVICGKPGGSDPVTGAPCADTCPHFSTGGSLGQREWAVYRQLQQQTREFDPDLIWSSTWFPGAAMATLAGLRERGTIQCFSAYVSEIVPNTSDLKQRVKGLLGPLRTRTIRNADRILAISRYTREQVVALGASPERVSVVPGGVAPVWFGHAPATFTGEPRMITIARLDEHKGHDVVISALPELVKATPDLVWDVVGPGPQDRLRRLACELGVEKHVRFHGRMEFSAMLDLTAMATVFVMPSREMPGRPDLIEGFGLVYLEAAALGVPSVAGRSGGIPDAVEEGITGYLVEPTSPQEVADRVGRLLREPELAHRMGQVARDRAAREFTWRRVVERMLTELGPHLRAEA